MLAMAVAVNAAHAAPSKLLFETDIAAFYTCADRARVAARNLHNGNFPLWNWAKNTLFPSSAEAIQTHDYKIIAWTCDTYFKNVEEAIFGPMPHFPNSLTNLGVNEPPSTYEVVIGWLIEWIKIDEVETQRK
jgi:hypothetical protein